MFQRDSIFTAKVIRDRDAAWATIDQAGPWTMPGLPADMAGDPETMLEDLACAARLHQGTALLFNAAQTSAVAGSDLATVRPARKS